MKMTREKWLKWLNYLALPLHFAASAFGYFLIEAISRHSVFEAFSYMTERPLVFLYNAFFIFTTTLIAFLVRRRVFARTIVAIFWMVLGIVNGVLLSTRVTPFTGPDLHLITDGFKIANKYLSPFFFVVVVILFVVAIAGLVFLFIKGPKYQGKMIYKLNIPLVLAGVLLFAGSTKLALEKRVLSNYFGNIAFAYQDYGYPYCLATTIFNTGISCPRDYSEESIEKIIESSNVLEDTGRERPNIIFLQLESFFDPTLVNYLEVSEDPIPYFRSLMKEYSSGYYKVPSVGAGTANTEFETITGMSLRYFGPGEYPYKSILKKSTCESAPYVLRDMGYNTHAIHNNEANFYGRRTVFANMGFDNFVSEEYMAEQNDTTPTDWMRDRNLKKYIMDCLKQTWGRDYIYTISVQGHGDYPEEPMIDNPKITVSGDMSDALKNKWEYYCNQLYEMDLFIKDLTKTLAEFDEDVVLVMYGDHLPTMGLSVKDLENRYLFQTQYVIWDNMGLKKKDMNLASYQIAAEVLDRVGIHKGNIFRFHQARRKTRDYQVDLETLQYDLLYGEKYAYGGKSPFKKTKLHLGIKDAVFTGIEKISDGRYYLFGENFTPSTFAEINGELTEVLFFNTTTVLLNEVQLKDGDEVNIAIRSNSSTHKVLTRTESIIYHEPVVIEPPAKPEGEDADEKATDEKAADEKAVDGETANEEATDEVTPEEDKPTE